MAALRAARLHTSRRRRLFGGATALLAVMVAGGMSLAATAGAATENREYSLSGTITVGDPPVLTLPAGSTFAATIDTTTGAITNGEFLIPTFERGGGGPEVFISLVQIGTISGVVDLGTGTGSLPLSLGVNLEIPDLQAFCLVGPIDLTLELSGVSFAPGAGPVTISADGFTVPEVFGFGEECDTATANAIGAALGLPTTSTALALTATYDAPATTTTTTPTTSTPSTTAATTTTTVATKAAAVKAQPRYTG